MREILRDAVETRFANKGQYYRKKKIHFSIPNKDIYIILRRKSFEEIIDTNQEKQDHGADVSIVRESGGVVLLR